MTPEKLGTLAEKLELSNALRKQALRDLAAERVEHGKTKALVHELEHSIKQLDQKIKEYAGNGLTKEEKKQIVGAASIAQIRANNKDLREREKVHIKNRNEMLKQMDALEKRAIKAEAALERRTKDEHEV